MTIESNDSDVVPDDANGDSAWLADVLASIRRRLGVVLAAPVMFALFGIGASFLVTPRYASHTTFLPPQQQSSAASALASLGALAGLTGNNTRNPADQYVALMQSDTVTDRMIERFDLMKVYDVPYRAFARRELSQSSSITADKKDGLITVEVTDASQARAAAMANQYVAELRRLNDTLAVSEAQQRRVFFENQLRQIKLKLVVAQTELQKSGFDTHALKAEPKAAADAYARLRANLAAAEVRLVALRSSLADTAPEVREQTAAVEALQQQLAAQETTEPADQNDPDYVGKYREFKYQETLFDLMARQYELARVDESREGALIQVIDVAQPAELKSWPKRYLFAIGGALLGIGVAGAAILRDLRQRTR